MQRIGLTGGIGSGKSTVCKIFEQLGIPIYYADLKAKELLNSDPVLISQITDLFGDEIYKDEKLDRQKLAGIVFNDRIALSQLNDAVHPAVVEDFEKWAWSQKDVPYVLKEAALIFEAKTSDGLDKIITVFAPEDIRRKRVMERDGYTEEQFDSRKKYQMDEEKKMKLADHVIFNDESRLLIPQVLELHKKLSTP